MGLFRKNCHTNRCERSEVYHYSSRPPPPPSPTKATIPQMRKPVVDDWSAPNPNPGMFTIKRMESYRNDSDVYLVAEINYTGCTNYEGNKVCVFKGISREELQAMKYLDPHFAESASAPIARFRPDADGWKNAKAFAKMLL